MFLDVVFDAFSHIKCGKGDGSSLTSDHSKCASSAIAPFLSTLFTSVIRHGYVPYAIRNCILLPVLKPNKDSSNSDSYRPIALALTVSKLFQWCVLIIYQESFVTSNLQFGFKKGHSTDLCTGLVKNVISHYVFNGSTVYGCLLGANKAFDRVDHSTLFSKLLDMKLPPAVAWA